jgi:hypothetical protein
MLVTVFAALTLLALALSATAAGASGPRAFELVSSPDKGGAEVFAAADAPGALGGSFFLPISSSDGDAAVYTSLETAVPDPVSNGILNTFRAVRGAEGWSNEQISSPIAPVNNLSVITYQAFTDDLAKGVQAGPLEPPLTPDASAGSSNLYLHDGAGFHLISQGLPALNPFVNPEAGGYSSDMSHVVLAIAAKLNDETPDGVAPELYDWEASTETIKAVGRLPNGDISPESVTFAKPPGADRVIFDWNPVSEDGSRIFFYTPAEEFLPRQLYVRIDGNETRFVSESKATTADPLGPKAAEFRVASTDGSVVFFTSQEKLTNNATTGPNDEGRDLYRYNVDTKALTDITVDGANANGADVQGVLGAADDGSRLYFVAKGVLANGATAGENNLYVWHDDGSASGTISFIASGVGPENWESTSFSEITEHMVGRATPDGMHALFQSRSDLTGFPANGHEEVFLYDAATEEIACASCNPEGTPATADAIAVGTGDTVRLARTLSDDGGEVFFVTTEQLAAGDTNSALDAYEFDAATGQISLISSGKGDFAARFADASSDGGDAFFVTRERLVGIDRDTGYDLYDARVGGGIASQNPSPPPPPCLEQECRAPTVPAPGAETPPSATLQGPGNATPNRHHHRKKHHRKHHKKQPAEKRLDLNQGSRR